MTVFRFNSENLEEYARKLDQMADDLEASHGDGMSTVKAAFAKDIVSFTQDGEDAPIYVKLKEPLSDTCDGLDSSIKAIIDNMRSNAKFLRNVSASHTDIEDRIGHDVSRIEVPNPTVLDS